MNNLDNNFWGKMVVCYPHTCKSFFEWFENYKIDNKWDELFGRHLLYSKEEFPYTGTYHEAPNYFELPLAFQAGIFEEYIDSIEKITDDKLVGKNENIIEEYLDTLEYSFNHPNEL